MKWNKVIDSGNDPFLKRAPDDQKIWLRIGGMGQGEGRIVILSPKEVVTYASELLSCIEKQL